MLRPLTGPRPGAPTEATSSHRGAEPPGILDLRLPRAAEQAVTEEYRTALSLQARKVYDVGLTVLKR
jgi:hypothetical protein